MLGWGHATKIYLATGSTDLRRGFNGLYALVRETLQEEPLAGHVFVFCNRRRDVVKILTFDGTGLWVCAKRLEEGTFRWPSAAEAKVQMEATELTLLLGGVDLGATRRRRWWRREKREEKAERRLDKTG